MSETANQGNVGQTEDPLFGLTLAEMTLIQQGLWAIGTADAVDPKLVADWDGLLSRLRPLIKDRIAAIEDSDSQGR